MAIYIYQTTTGNLVSWCPNDTDPVASAATLASNGLASVSGLPPLNATHIWSSSGLTVIPFVPPPSDQWIGTYDWLDRFTAGELAGVIASSNQAVQGGLYKISHTTQLNLLTPSLINAVNGLVSLGLLSSARAPTIMSSIGTAPTRIQ